MFKKFPVFLSLLAACSTSGPSPAPIPAEREELPIRSPEIRSGRWTFAPAAFSHRYRSTARTILELSDSVRTSDTLTTVADFSLAFTGEPDPRLQGLVHGVSLTGGTRAGQPETSTSTTVQITGHFEATLIVVDSVNQRPVATALDCTAPEFPLVPLITRHALRVPSAVFAGMTWTDTLRVSGCHGTVPLKISSIYSYTVRGETTHEDQPALLIERTQQVETMGEGAQGQHRVAVRSQGSGKSRLYVDRRTGSLLGAEGDQVTEVSITTSGRTRRFRQLTEEKTTRHNGS